MVNAKQSNIYTHKNLLQFYKRIFGIFYSQSHLPASIDRKFIKLSHFLNRNSLTFTLIYSLCVARILHWSYCQSKDGIWIRTSLFMIFNSFAASISLLSFLFHFEDVKKFWIELRSLNRLIYKRLNYTINYFEFKRSFIIGSVIFPLLLLICSMCAAIKDPISDKQKIDILFRIIHFYIEIHVIFIIGLFQYAYKMFGKSMDFSCRFRRSNLTVKNVNRIDTMIRYYKEIHYKIWMVSHEVNNIFGTSIIAFSLQSFFEATRFICFIFHRIATHRVINKSNHQEHRAEDFFNLISKHLNVVDFFVLIDRLFVKIEYIYFSIKTNELFRINGAARKSGLQMIGGLRKIVSFKYDQISQ